MKTLPVTLPVRLDEEMLDVFLETLSSYLTACCSMNPCNEYNEFHEIIVASSDCAEAVASVDFDGMTTIWFRFKNTTEGFMWYTHVYLKYIRPRFREIIDNSFRLN
jgi:hypothetical protein